MGADRDEVNIVIFNPGELGRGGGTVVEGRPPELTLAGQANNIIDNL
jgi:hypothetical protein